MQNKKFDEAYDFVKKEIELFDGYELLSREYKGCAVKLSLRCNNNHNFEMTYNDFKGGARCRYCHIGRMSIRINQANKMESVYKKYKESGDVIGGEFWDIIDESMFSMISITKLKGPAKERFKKLKVASGRKNNSVLRLRKIRDEDVNKYLEFISELVMEFPDILDDNWKIIFDNIYINKIRKYGVVG